LKLLSANECCSWSGLGLANGFNLEKPEPNRALNRFFKRFSLLKASGSRVIIIAYDLDSGFVVRLLLICWICYKKKKKARQGKERSGIL